MCYCKHENDENPEQTQLKLFRQGGALGKRSSVTTADDVFVEYDFQFFANFTRPLYRLLVIRKVRVVTYTGVWACKLFLCNIGNSVLQRLYNDRKRML